MKQRHLLTCSKNHYNQPFLARLIQSGLSVFFKSILLLHFHSCACSPNCHFSSSFSTKISNAFLSPPITSSCPADPILLNPLNAELNPICHFLALFGAHHILHVCRIRVNIITLLTFGQQCVYSAPPHHALLSILLFSPPTQHKSFSSGT